jgi:hypothetical protein
MLSHSRTYTNWQTVRFTAIAGLVSLNTPKSDNQGEPGGD